MHSPRLIDLMTRSQISEARSGINCIDDDENFNCEEYQTLNGFLNASTFSLSFEEKNNFLKNHWNEWGKLYGLIPRKSWQRKDEILRFGSKKLKGLEIAPYFNPLAPKRDGWNVKTLDVFSREELVKKAQENPSISSPDLIEEVDFCGSAANLKTVLQNKCQEAEFDFICSSHNFEHIPNPIKHLQDCGHFLKKGGTLSLAVPDLRACFDRLRMPTTLDEWIRNFYQDKEKPDPYDLFRHMAQCNPSVTGLHCAPRRDSFKYSFGDAYDLLKTLSLKEDAVYRDCHVSAFTPSSLILLVVELLSINLVSLVPIIVTNTFGVEFIIHFIKAEESFKVKKLNKRRIALNRSVISELAETLQ